MPTDIFHLMPGIVGIISKRAGDANENDLRVMMSCMMHEPFYRAGTYINDKLNIFSGSICIKDSFTDCMPVVNENEDIVLLLSGETFAAKDAADILKRRGHRFDPGDASYLIHLYEDDEEEFLQNLNGWFCGILIDLRRSETVLFNDRYGMQRIYYHENDEEFLFSTEAKSLLRIRPELRQIDLKGLGEFFSCGCVLENRTLFSDVFLLPGGSSWSFRNGKLIKKDYYFKPEVWGNQPCQDRETFYRNLKKTFSTILPKYFHAKQPVGVSLTGGLDTRLIMAYGDYFPGTLPCYTFGGMYRDSFDVKISREIARVCGQEHHVLETGKEFLDNFPALAEKTVYVSDGSIDIGGAPELYVNRAAREIAPIRMTGNFGSEVLRGVRALKATPPCENIFAPDFKRYIFEAEETFAQVRKYSNLSFTLFRQIPWYEYGRLAIEQSQLTLRTPFMDNDFVKLVYQAPGDTAGTNELSLRLIAEEKPALSKIPTDRGLAWNGNYLSAISSRIYREFLFKAEYCYNYGMPGWLARLDHTFADLRLERLFLGHHKFYHFRIWYRDELSEYVKGIVFDTQTGNRPYFNKTFLDEMIKRHINGNYNYTDEISKVVTSELIQRLFIE